MCHPLVAPPSSTSPLHHPRQPPVTRSSPCLLRRHPVTRVTQPSPASPNRHRRHPQRTDGTAPAAVGDSVEVKGWVRTVRNQKQFAFMQVGRRPEFGGRGKRWGRVEGWAGD